MAVIKTIRTHAAERARKRFSVKKAQDIVPIEKSIGDGIFASDGVFIRTWCFENINFNLLSSEMEEKVLKKWCETLNSLEPGATYKYTVMKQRLNVELYNEERLIKMKGDAFDGFRKEYNDMLSQKIKDTKLIKEQRYFQAAIKKHKIEDAKSFFSRSEPHLESCFHEIGSELTPVPEQEYIDMIWQFLHMDSGDYYKELDYKEVLKNRHTIMDFLAPYEFETNQFGKYIKIGNKFFRALYVPPNSYARYIKDTVLSELTALDKNMCISVDIIPIQTDEAYKVIEDLEFRSERNISNFKERQAKHGNFTAEAPFAMRKKAQQIEEYNYDLNERDQRLILGHITILHCADSIEELDEDTERLMTTARQQGCELTPLTLQQEDGFITAMPYGVNRFIGKTASRFRTLTTEGMASFIPFTVQEVAHKDGIYYGQNRLSKTPIFINRKSGMNGNAVILGSSGSGKSFKNKEEKERVLLDTFDKVILIDPDREYGHLVTEHGGQVIRMCVDSTDHINALDISADYGDNGNPISAKSEFVLTLYAMVDGSEKIDPRAKSIIDRCVNNVLGEYVKGGFKGEAPTLVDLREELFHQKDDLAKDIALTLELYTTGSLNLFSKQTNVDMENRIICFDLSELGDNLMPLAMLIITDFISNTLAKNRDEGMYTWVDIDEMYLMFLKEYTAVFFQKLWKRIRKAGGLCTGITQELGDLLKSPTARTMLANSDFLIILSANESDSALIQELLHLDDTQMSYITEVGMKNGVIKLGKSFIPFTDDFPKNTNLYKMMSTKFNEDEEA